MGTLLTRLPRLTLAQLRTLRSTTVGTCRRDLQYSHRPDGKIAHALALIHACATACATATDALVNYSMYVPQRPSKVPIAPMGFSHVWRLVLAGRRCLCPEWLGELLIVHHHWQHSFFCACSCSKVPIAPMGKLLTRLPRLTLAQLRTLRSTTGCTCCRDLAKFPSPRWENALPRCETHILLVDCRAAVSSSRAAQ
jgi:hypothetical protein